MAPITAASHLINPLAQLSQLETNASLLDGLPTDLEESVRYESSRLIQAAGVLLRIPQDVIAQAIVLLQRFWAGPDAGSILDHDAKDCAAAALYIAVKPSGHTLPPRQLLIVIDLLSSFSPDYDLATSEASNRPSADRYLTEGKYELARERLYAIEAHMLRVVGFDTNVALPYTLCINYLQALETFKASDGNALAKRAFAYLNTALLSPQFLYLTHQPSALATAAIYLAAREIGCKMPEVEWWEVFDVDREQLGFLVVAMQSVVNFAAEESRIWKGRRIPLTTSEIRAEIERR